MKTRFTYSVERDRFEAAYAYDVKDSLKSANWRFDGATRSWHCSSKQDLDGGISRLIADGLVADKDFTVDRRVAETINHVRQQRSATYNESFADEAHLVNIPAPAGMHYMPFQKAGIQYALKNGSVYIADEMGLGKTIQAIGVLNANKQLTTALVICPAVVRRNWQRELEKWLVPDSRWQRPAWRIRVIESTKKDFPYETPIVICSWDMLQKLEDKLIARKFGVVIGDEAHYMKSRKAKRTAAAMNVMKSAKQVLLLSGTPYPAAPIDWRSQLQALGRRGPHQNWRRWLDICRDPYSYDGRSMRGCNRAELDKLILDLRAGGLLVRRERQAVVTDLPPVLRDMKVLQPPSHGAAAKALIAAQAKSELIEKHIDEVDSAFARLEARKPGDNASEAERREWQLEADRVAVRLRSGNKVAFEQMAEVRRIVGEAKAQPAAEYIRSLLETGKKLVVYAHHRNVLDVLERELASYQPVRLDGQTPPAAKQAAVDRFQSDDACRVFIGSTTAAGVGITLTASSTAIFVEPDWSHAVQDQAESRLARIGQQADVVLAQYLVLDRSLDQKLVWTAMRKRLDADRLRVRSSPAGEPPVDPSPAPAKQPAGAAGPASASEAAKLIDKLSPSERRGIEQAIQILAGECDGAHSRDDVGFSKTDAKFGRSLARQMDNGLTTKQHLAAARMMRKYRRQLPDDAYEIIVRVTSDDRSRLNR